MSKQSVLEQAKGLSKQEQIDIAMDLWDMVDASDIPLSNELRAELDRRVAADKLDTSPGQNWDDLRAKLLASRVRSSFAAFCLLRNVFSAIPKFLLWVCVGCYDGKSQVAR